MLFFFFAAFLALSSSAAFFFLSHSFLLSVYRCEIFCWHCLFISKIKVGDQEGSSSFMWRKFGVLIFWVVSRVPICKRFSNFALSKFKKETMDLHEIVASLCATKSFIWMLVRPHIWWKHLSRLFAGAAWRAVIIFFRLVRFFLVLAPTPFLVP